MSEYRLSQLLLADSLAIPDMFSPGKLQDHIANSIMIRYLAVAFRTQPKGKKAEDGECSLLSIDQIG